MNSYFLSENTNKRFAYIWGLTSDDFYADSGMKGNLQWLLFKELKENGYQRIVFYHARWGLYCYDNRSFQLLTGQADTSPATATPKPTEQPTPASATAPKKRKIGRGGKVGGGLRMGNWDGQSPKTDTPQETSASPTDKKDNSWMTATQMNALCLTGMNKLGIFRQIQGILRDKKIPTAVIIDDANNFLHDRELMGAGGWNTLYNDMTCLPGECINIMLFIFPDNDISTIEGTEDIAKDDDFREKLWNIHIRQPNAMELLNMLHYFRLQRGLRVTLREMPEIARTISKCIARADQQQKKEGIAFDLRIKKLYHMLNAFAQTNKTLTQQNCYELFQLKQEASSEERLNQLIGMKRAKEELRSFRGKDIGRNWMNQMEWNRIKPVTSVEQRNDMMHIVLTGNPGTGKTTVAELLGQIFAERGYLEKGHLVTADRSDLVGQYIGETAIKTKKKVEEALGGVLFIDEAYSLTDDEHDPFGKEAVNTLVKMMDMYKGSLIVVVAGYKDRMEHFLQANDGLSSRFRKKIEIEDYTPEEMQEILLLHLARRRLTLSSELQAKLGDFCENWVGMAGENWGNAREAVNLAADLEEEANSDSHIRTEMRENTAWRVLEERHIPQKYRANLTAVQELRAQAVNDIRSMTGLRKVKEKIRELEDGMIVGNMTTAGHYLFIGNPGTGKTTVARKMGMIFRNHGLLKRGHCVEYTAGDLVNAVHSAEGQGKGGFRELAEKAVGGVLFIDEAYQLRSTNVGQRIIQELVPFSLEHRQDMCIILAGYVDDMNDLMKENVGLNSRFPERIEFENYNGEELFAILQVMLKAQGLKADESYLERSHRAIVHYTKQAAKAKDFGNARYLELTYIPQSRKAMNRRLVSQYREAIPDEYRNVLTGADIPSELNREASTPLPQKKEGTQTRSALEELQAMVGFASLKDYFTGFVKRRKNLRARGMEHLLSKQPLNIVLKGNPGTGKTTAAKKIGEIYKELGLLQRGHLVEAKREDLVAGYVGQTANKTKEKIEQAMGGILFIDEAYSLSQYATGSNDFGSEAITTLVGAMTDYSGEFAVIAAGYPQKMEQFLNNNEGFYSRFKPNIFTIEDYTPAELVDILRLKCKARPALLDKALEKVLEKLIGDTMRQRLWHGKEPWANGREMEILEQKLFDAWGEDLNSEIGELNGMNVPVYTINNLPEEYQKLLQAKEDKQEPKPARDEKQSYRIKASALPEAWETFSFDEAKEKEKSERALVLIAVENEQGKASGSGFMMTDDGYIVTCAHVVRGAKQIRVRLKFSGRSDGDISWHTARMIQLNEQIDAALLKIDVMGYPCQPMLPYGGEIQAGEQIFHRGYPFGELIGSNLDTLAPSMFQGSVSSVQIDGTLERAFLDMAAKGGCSGGPVYSKTTGLVLGILCGSRTKKNGELVEELNFMLPVKYIWENFVDLEE